MELLLNQTVHGVSLVKESALSAVSSVVEIAKTNFEPYLGTIMEVLLGYFVNVNFNKKCYKQLKGQAIETMTIIALHVGGKLYKKFA